MLRSSLFALITLALPVTAHAQCGGGFSNFVSSLKEEAMTGGYDRATVNRFFKGVRQDPAVLKADRAQGVFQKPFVEFSQRLISQGAVGSWKGDVQEIRRHLPPDRDNLRH